MKLTLLGTGSPEANARRASSGYLVEIGDDVILFDCGGGVVDRLLQSGRKPSDVTHLVFTHLHSDHMMDYAQLIHAAWDEGGALIKVFGPAPIKTVHERLFGREGALAFDLIARTELEQSKQVWVDRGGSLPRPWPAPEITEIQAGDTVDGEGWQIRSANAAHAQPLLDCFGFRLEAGGKVFVYSGDTAITPEIESLCADADLLLHWCYRLDDEDLHPSLNATTPTPQQIAAMATRAGVKQLILTHFRTHMDALGRHAVALAGIESPPTVIGEDLQIYIPGDTPELENSARIESVSDAIKLMVETAHAESLFRGEPEFFETALVPSFGRKIINDTMVPKLTTSFEKNSELDDHMAVSMFEGFSALEETYYQSYFEKAQENQGAKIQFDRFDAQHQGIPTSLLDWSRNPLVALFFACHGATSETKSGCVYRVETQPLPASRAFSPVSEHSYTVLDTQTCFVEPPRSSQRQSRQKSVYSYSAICWQPHIERDTSNANSVNRLAACYTIPAHCKTRILRELDVMGINLHSLGLSEHDALLEHAESKYFDHLNSRRMSLLMSSIHGMTMDQSDT